MFLTVLLWVGNADKADGVQFVSTVCSEVRATSTTTHLLSPWYQMNDDTGVVRRGVIML